METRLNGIAVDNEPEQAICHFNFLFDFDLTLTGYDCDFGNEMKGEEYLLSLVNIYIKCNKSLFAPFSLWITR